MKIYLNAIFAAVMGFAVTACGGSSNSEPRKQPDNPLVAGVLPTEEITYYTSSSSDLLRDTMTITIDPDSDSFKAVSGDGGTIVTGYYNAGTGYMRVTDCQSQAANFCDTVYGYHTQTDFIDILERSDQFLGADLVAIYWTSYYGVQLTDPSDMPQTGGAVTYEGDYMGYFSGPLANVFVLGDAVTQVNFDEGTISANITNLEEDLSIELPDGLGVDRVRIRDVEIDGNSFSGGYVAIVNGDETIRNDDRAYISGQFFGEDASNLGGYFYLDDRENDQDAEYDYSIDGAWNGVMN